MGKPTKWDLSVLEPTTEAIMAVTTRPTGAAVPNEREQFLSLLLANPNHFGNIPDSPISPVQVIESNTTYEELKCVGFSPELSRLEGVVWIKQPSGYEGGICTSGSQEYVRFYLSYDNGTTWLPQGTLNFTVYDVSGLHPLEYAVSLPIQPDKKLCFEANLPLVRAILSWGVPPSGPNAHPVWGNVIETRIQIPGFWLDIPFPILLEAAKVQLPPDVASVVAADAIIKLQAPKTLSAAELGAQYAQTAVPPHRFLQHQIQSALRNPANLTASSFYLASLGVDVSTVVAALAATNGDTAFEQLECIGLEEGDGGPDALIGTLVIKLPTGYLGSPCFAGSREYVAFWIDWGAGWVWVGTPSTNVHDIAAIPAEGLSYAVYLPVDLNAHRKLCEDGPVTAKVRAILSWDSPPPPTNPNFVPVWGNRLETNILVNPGPTQKTGNFTPYLSSICGVDPCDIDQTSGWAYPGSGDQPFGGAIYIYGSIPGAPLFVDPPVGLPVYQVSVQQIDTATNTPIGSPQILTDPFPIAIQKQVGGGLPTSTPQTQFAVGGFFTYQQMTPSAAGWNIVTPQGLLVIWNSGAFIEGTYRISVTAWDSTMTTPYAAGYFVCSNGNHLTSVVIDLDERVPVTIPPPQITGYKAGGVGPILGAVDCATFTVGDVIYGSYSVSDEHLLGFSFQAEPMPPGRSPSSGFTVLDGPNVIPVSGTYPDANGETYPAGSTPTGTVTGTWEFNTAGLPPCGYTIQLFTGDRTIVDCGTNWENNSNFVGFCLVAAA
jgi:hypothetical protein